VVGRERQKCLAITKQQGNPTYPFIERNEQIKKQLKVLIFIIDKRFAFPYHRFERLFILLCEKLHVMDIPFTRCERMSERNVIVQASQHGSLARVTVKVGK
jgi:hypothetical protein